MCHDDLSVSHCINIGPGKCNWLISSRECSIFPLKFSVAKFKVQQVEITSPHFSTSPLCIELDWFHRSYSFCLPSIVKVANVLREHKIVAQLHIFNDGNVITTHGLTRPESDKERRTYKSMRICKSVFLGVDFTRPFLGWNINRFCKSRKNEQVNVSRVLRKKATIG